MDRPWKVTWPASGWRNPDSRPKTVVFPAPLGPIRPTISPSPTLNERPFTAWRPPKCLSRPATSSMQSGLRSPERPLHPRHRALGKEEHDGDEEEAVHDQVDAGPVPAGREVEARQLGERAQDERSHDGPKERAGAAD